MPTSTLNKYAKKKGMQNKLLENGKDGNDMIFFCHYIVPLAEFETPRNDKFTVYREIKIKRKLQPDFLYFFGSNAWASKFTRYGFAPAI